MPGHLYAAESFSTWSKSYGGPGTENLFRSVVRASDGGYVIAGETRSFGAGSTDVWVIKVNEDGSIAWQRTWGGGSSDVTRSIQQTSDGGYVIAARTASFGRGSTDFWVIKLDDEGHTQWQKTYGGPSGEMPHAIQQTTDGGYIVAGYTKSFGAVAKDYFVIKLNDAGGVEWQKRFGGSGNDVVRYVKQVSDGGYVVAGFSHSFDVRGDILLLKLDPAGNIEWQKRYGGAKFEEPSTVLEVSDGYIVLEQSSSFTASTDAWIFKIEKDGDMIWQKTLGGRGGMDELSAAQLTPDGGFIAAGETASNGLLVEDVWVVKFSAGGNVQWQKRFGGSDLDEAESLELTPEGGSIIVGPTRSFGAGSVDILGIRLDSNGDILGDCISAFEIHDTFATQKNTNAVPLDVKLTVASTTVTVKVSDAMAKGTDAVIETQCEPTEIS
ncbi:MAG TPA: hypothetical protein VLA68_06355 [Nitrososphaera sp.]|nr:hypothetical protein [Nitrososphaera sp.]